MRRKLAWLAPMVLFAVANARGSGMTGSIWLVPPATAQDATLANVPGRPPDATFTVPNGPIDFSAGFNGGSFKVGDFISSGGGICTGGDCTAIMNALMSDVAAGTLIELTGMVNVKTGESLTVTHDDGLTLIIDGINLGFNPGPNAPTPTTLTWGGPTGNFSFVLVYGECCGPPAMLQTSLPLSGNTPEPSSLLLLLTGAGGILGFARRRYFA